MSKEITEEDLDAVQKAQEAFADEQSKKENQDLFIFVVLVTICLVLMLS